MQSVDDGRLVCNSSESTHNFYVLLDECTIVKYVFESLRVRAIHSFVQLLHSMILV